MTIKLNALLLTLGALLFGVGLILGLAPMSQSGANCGSAFSPSTDAQVSDLTAAMEGQANPNSSSQCRDALSGQRGIALALIIPGVLLALGGLATSGTGGQAKTDAAKRAAKPSAFLDPHSDAF